MAKASKKDAKTSAKQHKVRKKWRRLPSKARRVPLALPSAANSLSIGMCEANCFRATDHTMSKLCHPTDPDIRARERHRGRVVKAQLCTIAWELGAASLGDGVYDEPSASDVSGSVGAGSRSKCAGRQNACKLTRRPRKRDVYSCTCIPFVCRTASVRVPPTLGTLSLGLPRAGPRERKPSAHSGGRG
jgi:hypothetical protein